MAEYVSGRGAAVTSLPRSIRLDSSVEEEECKSTGGSLTEKIIKYGREEGDHNFIPHFRPGKKFARFTQKFRRRPSSLRDGCFPRPACLCPLCTSHRITHGSRNFTQRPHSNDIRTGRRRGYKYPNLHRQWNEGGRGSMLKENKI